MQNVKTAKKNLSTVRKRKSVQGAGALYHLTALNSQLNHAFRIILSAPLTMQEFEHNALCLKDVTQSLQNLAANLHKISN